MHKDLSHLSVEDAKAMDALVAADFDPSAVEAPLRDRAEKITELLGLLDHLPGHDGGGELVVQRTLAAIDLERQSIYAQASGGSAGRGLPLRELAAVMAIMVVGGTLLWPLMQHNRIASQRQACQTNLQMAAVGMGQYAQAYQGALPALKTHPGARWDQVNTFDDDGTALSNSAHLFVAVTTEHIQPNALICPGNDQKLELTADARDWPNASSRHMSYQNQYRRGAIRLERTPEVAILADVNPLFAQIRAADPANNSPNHAGRGQNVMLGNGAVAWMATPRLANGDMIYHAGRQIRSEYLGNELPTSDQDTFLVP